MSSPTPKKVKFNFSKALEEMLSGKKVTRKDWGDVYGYFKNDYLTLFKNGEDYNWIVTKADIEGDTWEVK